MRLRAVFFSYLGLYDNWEWEEYVVDYLDYTSLQDIKHFLDNYDVDLRNGSGQTALMLALIAGGAGGQEIIEELVLAGADVNASDLSKNTPLIWAAWAGSGRKCFVCCLCKGGQMSMPAMTSAPRH